MRFRILFLFIICSAIVNAQNNNSNIQVEYQLFNNTDLPSTLFATLHISNNISIYQEKYSTKQRWTERTSKLEEKNVLRGKNTFDPYLKMDHSKKEILFYDLLFADAVLVKDNYIDMVWSISHETKYIANIQCIKAITTYRGRQWIAWFSPEISVSSGPWKLHGLPGLILEAYDETNMYTIKALKIKYVKSDVFNKEFEELISRENKKILSYKELFEYREEGMVNLRKEIGQKRDMTVTGEKMPYSGKELKYEWEN